MKRTTRAERKTQAALLGVLSEKCKPEVIRRLQKKYKPGKGDYTKDRDKLLAHVTNKDIETWLHELNGQRRK